MHAARFSLSPLLGGFLLACSCSDDAASSATVTGTGAGGAGLAPTTSTGAQPSTSSSGGAGAGGTGGVPIPKPCPGYEGWETWDDFAPDGDFCVPASAGALPAPIIWEPCDPIAGMPVGCQQMQITWPTDADAIGGAASGWVERDGKVHLQFTRNAVVDGSRHRMFVVADAAGPVRSSMVDMNGNDNPKWVLWAATESAGVRQGKFVTYISEFNVPDSYAQAAIGGSIGDLHPKALHTWSATSGHSVGAASAFWIARTTSEIFIADWGGAPELVHTAGQGDGGQLTGFFPFGDMLFWKDQPWPSSRLWAYKKGTPAAYPLIPHNPTKHIDGFGTDGTHMVWVVSHEVTLDYDQTPFESGARDIMVSPYSETAAGLAPQRLRSYPSIYSVTSRFAVGCGYAAHADVSEGQGKGLLVRLSDGYSWQLPSDGCNPGTFCISDVLAITCDELFVLVQGQANIARISIDALGQPAPPD